MQVSDRVRVTKLERPSGTDRSTFVGREGRLIARLNVAWTPGLGALWKVRFERSSEEVFSESELLVLDADGAEQASEIPDIQEAWGKAPRVASVPFKRRLGGGSAAGIAVLAFLVFMIAGVLLIWAGVGSGNIGF